jgi:UDP-glucose 4-epimerase
MYVAIVGGNGGLGRAMQQCLPAVHNVRIIDQAPSSGAPTTNYRQVDILDLPALTEALRGAGAVIHLAAIRDPGMAPPETIFRVNTLGTYHVSLACEKLGITRIVFASSICYYGFLYNAKLLCPPYFPVDEKAPALPEDSYSLSKWIGEKIMSAFVQRTAGAVANLRYAYIMPNGASGDESAENAVTDFLPDEPNAKTWWTYVDMKDAASATWQALDYIAGQSNLCEAFNIGADDTHTTTPTFTLMERFFADTTLRFPNPLGPRSYAALFSNVKARQLLGFRPTPSTWRATLNAVTTH